MEWGNTREDIEKQKKERIGVEKYNNQGCLMRVIEYKDYSHITVEFQDKYKGIKSTNWYNFINGQVTNPNFYLTRIGESRHNNNGEVMKIIDYKNSKTVYVEFQDEYKGVAICTWDRFIKGKVDNPNKNKKFIGLEKENHQGYIMKIIEYKNNKDITVEFNDQRQTQVHSTYFNFENGLIGNPYHRIGEKKLSQDGFLMTIIDYESAVDITIEFDDEYKTQIHTKYERFKDGTILNPSYRLVCGVGTNNGKYKINENKKIIKEYQAWRDMLRRCYDKKIKEKNQTYKDVTCCNEWLLFENFYEWLHSQENFDKWYNGEKWAVDKDILIKGNKIYSPDTCCLVPHSVNTLFIKSNAVRGEYPIGVCKGSNGHHGYQAKFIYGKNGNKSKTTSYSYPTPEDAFYLGYKPSKEKYIKRIAQEEYDNGNITKRCYEAMINYQVEITD